MNRPLSSSSPFCGMFTSLENRVGTPSVRFSQPCRKTRSRLCRGALRSENGTVVFSFALVVDEMMNRKGGCANVTV